MRLVPLLIGSFLLVVPISGCATVVKGRHQSVTITSDPPGAEVKTDSGVKVTTPGSLNLVRNKNHVLVAEYSGCLPQQKEISHELGGWILGNILIGGIFGGVIDLASGSSDNLVPGKVHFDFTEIGQANARRRSLYLASHPGTDKKIRFAIVNELPVNGMTKDELIAAIGEPGRVAKTGKYEELIYENRKPSSYFLKDGVLQKTK